MKSERDGINPVAKPSGTGCVECLASGRWWFHLRRCAQCGHVGCCDSSPNQHASKHHAATGHPIITSFEPGEHWFYDYRTEEFITGPKLPAPPRIRWISRCPDRTEWRLQTGKPCFTTRARAAICRCGSFREDFRTPPGVRNSSRYRTDGFGRFACCSGRSRSQDKVADLGRRSGHRLRSSCMARVGPSRPRYHRIG